MRVDSVGLVRLDVAACWQFLKAHSIGRVAFAEFGEITVLPVDYELDGDRVVFRTAPGTKLAAAASGASAAFEVDDATELFETGTSVLARGRLHVATTSGELGRLRALPLHYWVPGPRDLYVVFDTEQISGRRIPIRDADGLASDGG